MSSRPDVINREQSFHRAPRDIQDLDLLEKLGDGLFGQVWKAKNKWSGEFVAVKKVKGTNVASKLEFLKEAKILKTLRNENLLRFLAMFVVEDDNIAAGSGLYLVTEFCEGGDLAARVVDHSKALPWPVRIRYAIDIARGLQYLHANHIIHRDLKCENCLIYDINKAKRGSKPPNLLVKTPENSTLVTNSRVLLADFGLARWYTSALGSNKPAVMTVCGTPWSMAPELMELKNKQGYSESCDIFSYGIVLCELATRRKAVDLPRSDDMGVDMDAIQNMCSPVESVAVQISSHPNPTYTEFRQGCIRLAQKCCQVVPAHRPGIDQVVQDLEALVERVSLINLTDEASKEKKRISCALMRELDIPKTLQRHALSTDASM